MSSASAISVPAVTSGENFNRALISRLVSAVRQPGYAVRTLSGGQTLQPIAGWSDFPRVLKQTLHNNGSANARYWLTTQLDNKLSFCLQLGARTSTVSTTIFGRPLASNGSSTSAAAATDHKMNRTTRRTDFLILERVSGLAPGDWRPPNATGNQNRSPSAAKPCRDIMRANQVDQKIEIC
jgi:hypothetical protein